MGRPWVGASHFPAIPPSGLTKEQQQTIKAIITRAFPEAAELQTSIYRLGGPSGPLAASPEFRLPDYPGLLLTVEIARTGQDALAQKCAANAAPSTMRADDPESLTKFDWIAWCESSRNATGGYYVAREKWQVRPDLLAPNMRVMQVHGDGTIVLVVVRQEWTYDNVPDTVTDTMPVTVDQALSLVSDPRWLTIPGP